jgi:polyphosphate kinase 2 (PPK2 family)
MLKNFTTKEEYEETLRENIEALSDLQQLLYDSNKYSVLLICLAMNAAGKDGIIRHVLSGINPQGCQVLASNTLLLPS